MLIISIKSENGIHSIENHNWLTQLEQIPTGFAYVPDEFQSDVNASLGYCDIEVEEETIQVSTGKMIDNPEYDPPTAEEKTETDETEEETIKILPKPYDVPEFIPEMADKTVYRVTGVTLTEKPIQPEPAPVMSAAEITELLNALLYGE